MLARLLVFALVAIQANAAWQRHVLTPEHSWFDTPAPHPLAYYTKYPALRDHSDYVCYLCSDDERLVSGMQARIRNEVKLVGILKGFEVYDLFYRLECKACVDRKAILVRTGTDQYREINHVEPSQIDASAGPSFVVNLGGKQILGARYMAGGNKGA